MLTRQHAVAHFLTFPPACTPLDDNSSTKELPQSYSTVDLVNEEQDPWDLPELKDTGVKWSGEAAHGSLWLCTEQKPSQDSDSVFCFSLQIWIQRGRF